LFLMVVMFMPRGIHGVIVDAGRALRRKGDSSETGGNLPLDSTTLHNVKQES